MAATSEFYSELIERLKKSSLLGSCSAVLGWDEQVNLPQAGGEHRAEQLALLAGMTHEQAIHPRIGELLSELEAADDLGDEGSTAQINVKHARRAYDRDTKLPQQLVEELSRVTTLSQQAWGRSSKEF